MQYVRSFSGSVSKTWNSINPATLSGAIDVVVVELEDGEQYKNVLYKLHQLIIFARVVSLFSIPRSLWEVFLTPPV